MRDTHFHCKGLACFFSDRYAADALRPTHVGFTIPAMTVGEAIKALRKLAKLTQIDLAAQVGARLGEDYAQSNISRIESGTQLLDTKQLQLFAEILNVRASDIFAMAEEGVSAPRVSQYLQAYSKLSARQVDSILALAEDE